MKKLFVLSLIVLSLVGCENQHQSAETAGVETSSQTVAPVITESSDFPRLIKQAEDLYTQTEAVNHAWSVNLDRLKEARQSALEGDMDNAIANAEEAIKLAELALIQAEAEKTLWQERVPK